MMIISSREFRDHLKKYFDLVDQNEQIIVQRGKDKAYIIAPLNDSDRLSVNEELIQTVREAEEEYSKQGAIRVKDPGEIWKVYCRNLLKSQDGITIALQIRQQT
jgi:hypothetical protein